MYQAKPQEHMLSMARVLQHGLESAFKTLLTWKQPGIPFQRMQARAKKAPTAQASPILRISLPCKPKGLSHKLGLAYLSPSAQTPL